MRPVQILAAGDIGEDLRRRIVGHLRV